MVALVDHRGRPLRSQELAGEPQTSRLGQLTQEFAGHPTRGLTPSKLARILEEAEQGQLVAQADLFADMEEKDGHIFAEMSKRKRVLLGLEWDLVPPRGASAAEEKATEQVREIITDVVALDDVILDMADAIGHAFSCLEIEWAYLGREWLPEAITHRPPRWFTVGRDDPDEIRLRDNSANGESLRPFGWIVHTHKARSGHLARAGLHRILAWPFLFKNFSVRDLAEFLEIYGLPARLGKYPPGANPTEKATLLRAVMAIGHNAAGIIPEGMDIDFKEAAKGAADPFQAMIDWCERTQSKAILGGTLTSQADGASSTNALGNVHNEVRWDLTISDARQIAASLTRYLVYPLAMLNTGAFTGLRRCPRFVFDTTEPEDLKLYADALPQLVGIGLQIPAKWAHEKLRIPLAEKNDEVLQRSPWQPVGLRHEVRTAALRTTQSPASDALPAQLERLQQEGDAAVEEWIDQVRELVQQVDSLEELRDRLLAIYPQLDPGRFAEVMAEAMAAAHLAGRYDILEGV